jgi:hypothetical protein
MVAGLRRLAVAILLCVAVTVAVSLVIGALVDASLVLGFYLMGCFLMVAGFFVGNRGPARIKSETPGPITPFGAIGDRRLRWATLGEQEETINSSAVLVGLGVVLVVIGVLLDGRHAIF